MADTFVNGKKEKEKKSVSKHNHRHKHTTTPGYLGGSMKVYDEEILNPNVTIQFVFKLSLILNQ